MDKKPPLGLRPRNIFYKQIAIQRQKEIFEAMWRYSLEGISIPIYWLSELEPLLFPMTEEMEKL